MRPIDADALYEDMLYEMCSTGFQTNALSVIRRAPTIAPSPNEPLTLEELRKMDGEPVWVVEGKCAHYALITDVFEKALYLTRREDESEMLFDEYGKTWTAYRRPEEGTK